MSNFSVHDIYSCKDPESYVKRLEIDKISRLGMNVYNTHVDQIKDGIIEYFLWYRGKCMVWYSKDIGWIATDCTEVGYGVDGVPNKWKPSFEWNSLGLETPELSEDECAVFYDCMDWHLRRSDVLRKCEDFADTHMTIRQQVINQKTPMIGISGNPKIRDKLKNIIFKIRDNASVLFIDSDLNNKIATIDFNAPYNVESLYQYKKSIESEMLEQIGIDFKDAFQKKERLVVDEQEGNDEMLNYLLADGLKAREMAIEKCKKLGLSGSTEIQGLVRPIEEIEELGTSNNEPAKNEVN